MPKQPKKTWGDDECLLRKWINPAIGHRKLDQIETKDIVRLQQHMKTAVSGISANRMVTLVKHMYNLAISWGEVTTNPAVGIKKYPEKQRERYLTPEETRKLIAVLADWPDQKMGQFFMLLMLTGARKSEGMKAKWSDFSLDNRIWTVPQENSKSGKKRHIPLSAATIKLLQSIEPVEDSPYVFPKRYDPAKPMVNPNKAWQKIRIEAGIPDMRIHDLRHNFASMMVSNGCSLYEVQKVLGHASPEMTQRYSHLAQSRLIEAADVAGQTIQSQKHNVDNHRKS